MTNNTLIKTRTYSDPDNMLRNGTIEQCETLQWIIDNGEDGHWVFLWNDFYGGPDAPPRNIYVEHERSIKWDNEITRWTLTSDGKLHIQ